MNEDIVQCEKCKAHYQSNAESLDFAFKQIAGLMQEPIAKLAEEYFARYHDRGHRRVLRDD